MAEQTTSGKAATGTSQVIGQTATGGAIRKIAKFGKGIVQSALSGAAQVILPKPRVHSVDFENGEILIAVRMPETGKRRTWLAKQSDVDKGRASKLGERVVGNKVDLTEPVGNFIAGEALCDTDGEPLTYDGHPIMFQIGAYYTTEVQQVAPEGEQKV